MHDRELYEATLSHRVSNRWLSPTNDDALGYQVVKSFAKLANVVTNCRAVLRAQVNKGRPGARCRRIVALVVEILESNVHSARRSTSAHLRDERLVN
jgi:hypothetical protein